jgi:site-specific DNA-methyltransferase (adenine-specific)
MPLERIEDKIINGDAFEIMPTLPKVFVDLLIVDPPYNLTKDYNGTKFRQMNDSDYAAWTILWIEKVLPLLKDTASIYVCCDWKTSLIIGVVLKKYFKIKNRITWEREKGRGAKANWKNSLEDIWFACMSDKFTFNVDAVKIRRKVIAPYRVDGAPKDWVETSEGNFRDSFPSNFWSDISVPFWSMPENTAHPVQKPEKLLAKLILASSNKGDIVFDPFSGSGSTCVAAKKLGRRFVAIEKDKTYCIWAQKRLESAIADPSIQGFRDDVFWERNTFSRGTGMSRN